MAGDTKTIEERPSVLIRNRIVIWYHESDLDLVQALESHVQLLVLRLGNQFQQHYFGYPKVMPKPQSSDEYPSDKRAREEYQGRYERVIQGLEYCALFVPCVSNTCMVQMWKDTERDPRLSKIFAQRAFETMPVLMRPTNTGEANLPEPLSAHEGYQREVTCGRIAATIEALRNALGEFCFQCSGTGESPILFRGARNRNYRTATYGKFLNWRLGRTLPVVVARKRSTRQSKKDCDMYKHEVRFSNLAATEPLGGVGATSRTDDPSNPYQLVFSTDERLGYQQKKELIETLEIGKAAWNITEEAERLAEWVRSQHA